MTGVRFGAASGFALVFGEDVVAVARRTPVRGRHERG